MVVFIPFEVQSNSAAPGKQQRRQNGSGPAGSPPTPHLPPPPPAEYQSAMPMAGVGAVRKKPTSAHQIVSGSGDILTRRGRPHHRGHQQNGGGGGKDGPNRKFSSLVNEYVGNCLEDNCNIGEGRRERAESRRLLYIGGSQS